MVSELVHTYVCPLCKCTEASEGHPVFCSITLCCVSLKRSLAELGAHCVSARLALASRPHGYPQPHFNTRVPGLHNCFWLFTWVLTIRTQVFMFVQQVLLPTEPSPHRPCLGKSVSYVSCLGSILPLLSQYSI